MFITNKQKEEYFYMIILLDCVRKIPCGFYIDNNLKADNIFDVRKALAYDDGKIAVNLKKHYSVNDLIKTIAYEIAHGEEWNHGANHKRITKEYTKLIKAELGM